MVDAITRGARFGPYEVLDVLGRGGMGAVYRARDLRLGRVVALKVVAEELAGVGAVERQLVTEARATASLAHPNIVTLYDVGSDQGRVWVALEYVEGETLADRLRRGPPPHGEALRIGRALAHGLAAAHAAGIVHRDLKPGNVLLGTDGRPRILDFGIARIGRAPAIDETLAPLPASGEDALEMLGTPRFMAPEQWSGDDGPAADVWALGLILHLLFSGAHPLPKLDRERLARLVQGPDPVPLAPSFATQPEALRDVVTRSLSKAAGARPSASEIADALDALDAGGPERSSEAARFRGLEALGELDASRLAGRADDVDACAARLAGRGLVVVTGPPGVGKTSLVLAGLVPRLRSLGELHVIALRPGSHPIEHLAAALLSSGPSEHDELRTEVDAPGPRTSVVTALRGATSTELARGLRAAPTGLSLLLLSLARAEGKRIALVVDQLEELMTAPREDALAFAAAVVSAASAEDGIDVILSVRDDVLGRVPWGDAAPSVLSATVQLAPPDRTTLRQAVIRPLAAAGYALEDPSAAERLAEALVGLPYALPLLQIVLARLWRSRSETSHLIPKAATDAIDDPTRVLAELADGFVDGLAPADVERSRRVLVRLVTPERTRARADRSALREVAGAESDALVDRMIALGLLTSAPGDEIELAHEAIIDHWDRLASWLDKTDVASAHVKELEHDAQRWARNAHARALLPAPDELDRIEGALGDREHRLSANARRFLDEARTERTRSHRLRATVRAVLVGSLLVALVAALVAAWALREREATAVVARARAEQDRAALLAVSAEQRLAVGDVPGARALARAALERGDDVRTRSLVDAIRDTAILVRTEVPEIIYGAARAPGSDRVWLATQSPDLRAVEVRSGALSRLTGHGDQVTVLAVTPSGTVVSADWRGVLRATEPDGRGRELVRLGEAVSAIVSLGRDDTVATISAGALRLLSLDDGSARALGDYPGHVLAFGGARLWLGREDGHVVSLDLADGRVLHEVDTGRSLRALAASPDGTRIAVGTADGLVAVHDAADGAPLLEWSVGDECRRCRWVDEEIWATCGPSLHALGEDGSWARREPDGTMVTDVSVAGSEVIVTTLRGVTVYQRDAMLLPVAIDPPEGLASAIGVSRAAGLAIVGTVGRMHALSLDDGRLIRAITLHGHEGTRELRVADGAVLAAHAEGFSRFTLPGLHRTHLQNTGPGAVDALAVDGDRVLVGTHAGPLVEVSLASRLGRPLADVGGHPRDVVLTSNGTWIAAVGRTLLWPTAEGLGTRDMGAAVLSLALDPLDRVLVGTADGRALRLATVEVEAEPLADLGTRVYGIRGRADGLVVLAGADHLARIRRPDGALVTLRGHRGEVNAVELTEDGQTLLSTGDDATLRAWSVETGEPLWETAGFDLEGHSEPLALPARARRARLGTLRCEVVRAHLEVRVGSAEPRTVELAAPPTALLALPWGCVVSVGGTVSAHLVGPDASPRELATGATAVASAGARVAIALEAGIVLVDEHGAREEGTATSTTVSQLLVDGSEITWGDVHGVVRSTATEVHLEPIGTSAAVTHLAMAGPGLLVGRADGSLEIWDPVAPQRLHVRRFHGAVVDSRLVGSTLHVMSELGDHRRLDLRSTVGGWCDALRELWSATSLGWRDGRMVSEPPPSDHPCAVSPEGARARARDR